MIVKTKGLSYVGDIDHYSRYTYFVEGRRVFDVVVDLAVEVETPEGLNLPEGASLRRIFIAMVDAPATAFALQETTGAATLKPYVSADGVTTRISSDSVRGYVEPRVLKLLARVYVPAAPPATETPDETPGDASEAS